MTARFIFCVHNHQPVGNFDHVFRRAFEDAYIPFLEVMEHRADFPVLIHCRHGRGRAALFSAIYRIEFEGWPNDRARSRAYWGSGLGGFTPDSRKGRFLLDCRRRLPAAD